MKTNAAAAPAKSLEQIVTAADTIPSPSDGTGDGMAFVHKINVENKIYGNRSENIYVSFEDWN